jgi:hypothetical protein
MRFIPYVFFEERAADVQITHEVRDYLRSGEARVITTYKSKVSDKREVVKRTFLEFLNECDEHARYAFDRMIVANIYRARRARR